jgi:type I restriction-modification system DNA methylase subunit
MTAPKAIHQLVEHFEHNRDALRSGKYNEAQLRQEFLNPFFAALGWDMLNTQQFGEAYKEVIHETSVEVEGAAKAPDYAFRIGGVTKFFVEAKKPSVNIEHAIHPAYQVKRYAWSAKLPLAILSDFEEFAVYDCRSKPNPTDQAATGRVMYLNYRDYIEKWDQIASIFSKDAIQKGAFDQYAQGVKGKRGTKEVDDAFLEEMEEWRELLAKNLALRNPGLENVRSLNYAVQMTIDRIVFLRICEDRGIEKEGQLKELLNETPIYEHLCAFFKDADKRYNSGLFHFEAEKGQSSHPDDLTLTLKIDDKVLKEIITDLYYPSPYVFKLIPTEILGQVYERFLGKVIRLTAGHQAKVEEKPEVRKAGGVYYTPTYIVDYIVRNTVGKLLEGRTPKEAAELKIVDPACGSGSFLLGAYQCLIDWHTKYYNAHEPEKLARGGSPAVYRAQGGEWKLTTTEKKRILLNNIHGVDIDAQAVEVTKLSLLLKVLEGESQESIGRQLSFLKERALPDLGRNIQCGNSLIGPDYYADRQMSMDFMDEEERQRVNAFDWKAAFPQVFAGGGFDAVIGNPPYSAKQSIENKILTKFYKSIEYKCDPYGFFIERGFFLMKTEGFLGYIIPVTWMTNYYYMKLRKLLIDSLSLMKVVLINGLVFEDSKIDTSLLFLNKEAMTTRKFDWSIDIPTISNNEIISRDYQQITSEERFDITPNTNYEWNFIRQKIENQSIRLDSICKISLGMKLRANNEFVINIKNRSHPDGIYFGSDFSRYGNCIPKRFFNFSNAIIIGGTKNPKIQRAKPKILVQAIRNLSLKRRIVASIETEGDCFVGTVNGITMLSSQLDIYYILGIINSNLANEFFRQRFTTISLTSSFLGAIPIRKINFSDKLERFQYENIISHTHRILILNQQQRSTPQEKESLQREIEATDRQIDQLVYELYGLTEEEIKIVEGVNQ